jgi:hypothetical protein
MNKQKGWYCKIIPVYYYEEDNVEIVEGRNWFFDSLLAFAMNLQIKLGILEEIE